jgi:hypothetical protein
MSSTAIDRLLATVRNRLAKSGYADRYKTESAFEADVWARLLKLIPRGAQATCCLTSHKKLPGRSHAAWTAFCREERGPDVNALGSKNRLDIVVKHPRQGSLGIEVKCLGRRGHARKLTQGLGQAMLALAHRDRTLLLIHCGTVPIEERKRLRGIADAICQGARVSIVVVPDVEPRTLATVGRLTSR